MRSILFLAFWTKVEWAPVKCGANNFSFASRTRLPLSTINQTQYIIISGLPSYIRIIGH